MIALVDYDNLRAGRRGLDSVMRQILDAVGMRRSRGERAMRCRLYGGWFEGRWPSKRAQRLGAAIDARFPCRIPMSDSGATVTVRVTMELARSLVGDRIDFTHTYRRRSLPPNLLCAPAPFEACARPSQCAIAGFAPFVRDAECPVPGCDVAPAAVLTREEQKLVDSMMVVDLVRLAQTTSESLILVSSDDDMWPGIRAALLHGAHVLHVRARGRPFRYPRLATATYEHLTVDWEA